MKKTYHTPCVEVQKINATEIICVSTLGTTEAVSGNLAKDRDRGDYEPAEDADNFGDLW